MPDQLTFFGTWEAVVPVAEAPPPEPPPELPPATDPRQCGLFDGPLTLIHALETASARLDLAGLRAAWQEAQAQFPQWARAQSWSRWIADLEWLTQESHRPLAHAEQVRRALVVHQDPTTRFWGMGPALRARVVSEALAQAAYRWVEAEGPEAHLDDGRPVAWLLMQAGRPAEAVPLLQAAVAAQPGQARLYYTLGEALWRSGQREQALGAYRDACLIEPGALDEAELTCAPLLDLLDRAAELELPGTAAAWAPVLADLEGVAPLARTTIELLAEGPAPRVMAALLAEYRRKRSRGALPEPARMEIKRAMLKAAPELKEFVRRL
jgi:tetratricopeptide (TPR) repeat protein